MADDHGRITGHGDETSEAHEKAAEARDERAETRDDTTETRDKRPRRVILDVAVCGTAQQVVDPFLDSLWARTAATRTLDEAS
jgi:hypothetical protein